MKQIKITIRGDVQGVFFRAFVNRVANQLHVKGYARNTPDGNVEAVAQGTKEQLDKLVAACKKGPEGSRVDEVKVEEQETEVLSGFHISLLQITI